MAAVWRISAPTTAICRFGCYRKGVSPPPSPADVGVEPLEHARRTAEEYETQGLDFRLCDGLSGIEPEETDTVVIAGMGGETIRDILRAAPWRRTAITPCCCSP